MKYCPTQFMSLETSINKNNTITLQEKKTREQYP
jgi:hypothetical protein